jgi:hypothetical protein
MADKVPVKTAIIISFLCGIIMILCACMNPVDIQAFIENEQVQDIIEAGKVAVIVDDLTEDNLKGRDRRIEGLNPNKYYMVEKEQDVDGTFVAGYPKYVTDKHPTAPQVPGALWGELQHITKISGGRINALTNFHTYTVRDAKPFANDTPFTYSIGSILEPDPLRVKDGKITIPKPKGTLALNFTNTYYGYEVMAVAVTPDTLSPTSPFDDDAITISPSVTSFRLEGQGTTVDYVFVKITDTPTYSIDFRVLTVEIPTTINIAAIAGVTRPVTGATPVTAITPNDQYTGTVTWSGSPTTFAPSTVYTATITLTPKAGYTLTGVDANYFTVTEAVATNPINSGVITAVFPATDAPAPGSVSFTITLEAGELMNAPTSTTGFTLDRDNFDGTNIVTLTLAVPTSGGSWDTNSIEWSIGGIAPGVITGNVSGNDLTINNGSGFWPILADSSFDVCVTATKGGAPYSAKVRINVGN